MPPSRNDLWLILIIAGLCATAALFVYLNNTTRSTNRVLRQQTASLIEQVEQLKGQVKSEWDQKSILLAHAADLKSLLRKVGTHVPAATLAQFVPTKGIVAEDVVSFRQLDAVRVLVTRKPPGWNMDTNTPFVCNTGLLRHFATVRTMDGVIEAELTGERILFFGFTNYSDLLLEGIIPLRINGSPLKTELRIDAAR